MTDRQKFREGVQKLGWKWHKHYISKKVGKKEITIEFCIGDFCVGLWENQSLVHEKKRVASFIEALIAATVFEQEVKKDDKTTTK